MIIILIDNVICTLAALAVIFAVPLAALAFARLLLGDILGCFFRGSLLFFCCRNGGGTSPASAPCHRRDRPKTTASSRQTSPRRACPLWTTKSPCALTASCSQRTRLAKTEIIGTQPRAKFGAPSACTEALISRINLSRQSRLMEPLDAHFGDPAVVKFSIVSARILSANSSTPPFGKACPVRIRRSIASPGVSGALNGATPA